MVKKLSAMIGAMSLFVSTGSARAVWVAALSIVAFPAAAAETTDGGKTVQLKSGEEVRIGVFTNLNTACTGLPAPQIALTTTPKLGTLIIRLGLLRVPPTAPNCAGKDVPAMSVFFKANADTQGADAVALEMSMGQQKQAQSYQIAISK